MPQTTIHRAIVEILADFATNLTRYFNLDMVTEDPRVAGREDPIAAWSRLVTDEVLANHYRTRLRQKHEARAQQIDSMLAGIARVRFHADTGESIDTAYEGSRQTALAEFARPWERMYVLQIARFVGGVLSQLGNLSQKQRLEDVPYLSEFFALFNNSDRYFRSRSKWSIH